MKGFLKVETIEGDGKEGIMVQCDMTETSFLDRMCILDGITTSLHMDQAQLQLQLFCNMRKAGAFGKAENIRGYSSKTVPPADAESNIENLLGQIFGGGI